LASAVEEAYQGMLMTGRHPLAVLDLRLPHEEVDVNVHPTKAEVRFRDESAVFGAIQKSVRRAVIQSAPVPVAGPGLGFGSGGPALALAVQPAAPPLWQHAVGLAARAAPAVSPAPSTEASAPTPAQALPVLRVIGQFGAIYIIAEGPDGIYLIDQHAAHERV